MKRMLLPLLLVCLFLCGCGSRANEKCFTAFSEALAGKETLSFAGELRAEYADRSLDFTLNYQKDSNGETIGIVKPERISGIKAHLAPGSSTVEYEGLILDAGPLDPYGLTPMNALPKLVEVLTKGHLDSVWKEKDSLVGKFILDDHVSVSVWLDPQKMIPHYAELQSDDTVHIFCQIHDWR